MSTALAGSESGPHDRTDLGRLPDSKALEGLKTGEPVNEHSSLAGDQFSLDTALTSLLTDPHKTKSAISVGPVSPPVPRKVAEKIWRGEYIELLELLPERLGAPGPTVLDALLQSDKVKPKKSISTIQDWVMCFNTFISVVAIKDPSCIRDLLAYSSTIVKASQDFEGTPWLDYDAHFRRQMATRKVQQWDTIDASVWTMYFSRATPKIVPGGAYGEKKPQAHEKRQPQRYNPYPARVCFRWNSHGGCQLINCKFRHCCTRCQDTSHTAIECPQRWKNPSPPPSRHHDQPPPDPPFRPPMGRR